MHLISSVDILFHLKLQDIGDIEENLERLNNETWVLKQESSVVANQIEDQNFNALANQNKKK